MNNGNHMNLILPTVVKRELPWGIYKCDDLDLKAWVVFRAKTRAQAVEEYKRLLKWRRPGEHYRIREDCQ